MILRIVILHCIGEIVLLSGYFVTMPFNGYSMTNTYHVILQTFIARTIMCIILLPIARLVIWVIQHKIERVVVFDYKQQFNLFKFGIKPNDSVQFNTISWDKVDVNNVDLKKIAVQFYSSRALVNIKI
jgi:hypothetical protein